MKISDALRVEVEDSVRQELANRLAARGLLLPAATADSALTNAAGDGALLLHRLVAHLYSYWAGGGSALDMKFDGGQDTARVSLALAFGAVSARVLGSAERAGHYAHGPVELLCAAFNLGIGLIDGLCDTAPQAGLQLLDTARAIGMPDAARNGLQRGQLRDRLPADLAADPTVAFTARVVEAFFDLLHVAHPGAARADIRDRVGEMLAAALEAEYQSVTWSTTPASRGHLIELSRRTSVLPFQVLEHLVTGTHEPPAPTAGTLLGEAMWRIDDLVDLTQDARLDALNGLLVANRDPSAAVPSLEQVLASGAITTTAEQAAQYLDAGLAAADRGVEPTGRRAFLAFVQRYAGISLEDVTTSRPASRRRP